MLEKDVIFSLLPVLFLIPNSGYLQPRRQAFGAVLERAKARNELHTDIEPDLVFDLMSGAMLYAMVFQPTDETFEAYIRRALELCLKGNTV